MSWADRTSGIKVGDRVAYKASYLRSTGQQTGPMPFARSVVTELKDQGSITLATVDWNDDRIPAKVAVKGLSKITERGIADE